METREEGGTPAIVESIRAGLVFQLKEAASDALIEARDRVLCKLVTLLLPVATTSTCSSSSTFNPSYLQEVGDFNPVGDTLFVLVQESV